MNRGTENIHLRHLCSHYKRTTDVIFSPFQFERCQIRKKSVYVRRPLWMLSANMIVIRKCKSWKLIKSDEVYQKNEKSDRKWYGPNPKCFLGPTEANSTVIWLTRQWSWLFISECSWPQDLRLLPKIELVCRLISEYWIGLWATPNWSSRSIWMPFQFGITVL